MAGHFLVPDASALENLLAALFEDEIKVSNGKAPDLARPQAIFIASYIDDGDAAVAACTCDRSFAAYASAALTRIPATAAADCARGGEFTEMMLGNLHEVMNLCSTLLMDDSTAHLRLGTVDKGSQQPAEVLQLARAAPLNGAFDVEIVRYGKGKLAFAAL